MHYAISIFYILYVGGCSYFMSVVWNIAMQKSEHIYIVYTLLS